MSDMVTKYNKGMGGVDLLDSMVATYRIPIRSKKWWFPFYTWSLSVSVVNAWKLKCHATGGDEPLLDFLWELVVEMLKTHGKSSPAGRSVATLEPEPGIVYEMHHWPTHTGIGKDGKFRRLNCRFCYDTHKNERKSTFMCDKCGVTLHVLFSFFNISQK